MIQISPIALTFFIGAGFLLLGKWAAAASYYKEVQRPHKPLGWRSAPTTKTPTTDESANESFESVERMLSRHF